jgi:hypothetical protein
MGPGNGSWLVDSKFLAGGQTAYKPTLPQIVSSVNREQILGLENGLWLVDGSLQRMCVNRYSILGPLKTVRDWWNEEFGPVDKINVSRMWIGWILLGPENNGLWLVEHSFSSSGENRIHTHTHAHTLQNNGQQYEQGNFLGPCVIGRLWLLGHWTTQKECDHWTIGPSVCPVPSPSDSKGRCKLKL